MLARIYQREKNAMQSGRARTDKWILEFLPSHARRADPLMGWAGSGDTQVQVQLQFASLDLARSYAETHGITYNLAMPTVKTLKLQSYADNFR